jgi:hypothetical protein
VRLAQLKRFFCKIVEVKLGDFLPRFALVKAFIKEEAAAILKRNSIFNCGERGIITVRESGELVAQIKESAAEGFDNTVGSGDHTLDRLAPALAVVVRETNKAAGAVLFGGVACIGL